jgi:hypothetical protein
MALDQDIGKLVDAANHLTDVVDNKIQGIDAHMVKAQAQFDEWRAQKDIVGDPTIVGTRRMSIFQGEVYGTGGPSGVASAGDFPTIDLGSTENVYVHFKTPLNVRVDDAMFWFNLRGYCYGSSSIIDETIVGYCYHPQVDIIRKHSVGNMHPDSYHDQNGNVVLRILLPSAYYTTLCIDTMRVGDGRLFKRGDLKAALSLMEKVVFD